jgi:hypothetical protein
MVMIMMHEEINGSHYGEFMSSGPTRKGFGERRGAVFSGVVAPFI